MVWGVYIRITYKIQYQSVSIPLEIMYIVPRISRGGFLARLNPVSACLTSQKAPF